MIKTLSDNFYFLTHRVMSLGPVLSRSVRYIHIMKTSTILKK